MHSGGGPDGGARAQGVPPGPAEDGPGGQDGPRQDGPPPHEGEHTPGRLIDNRYQLQHRLGRGGMGVVWEARDTRLHRQVAVKELLFRGAVDPETQAQWVERARREAQAIARIGHEHVVTVYDVTEADGQVWIVMEQVNPRSLADLLRAHGRLPVQDAARICLEVLRGLRAVHAAGVLHRDVKPHNVLFRRDGRAVLMDFGIATFEGAAQVTRLHETVGTPSYLAPELCDPAGRRPPAPASDLWSLGVTLYEMVEGRLPFRGPAPYEVLLAVREDDPPPPEHAGPLGPVLAGLLTKDPARRLTAVRAEELLRHVVQETPVTPARLELETWPLPSESGDGGGATPQLPETGATAEHRRWWRDRRLRLPALAAALVLVAGACWFGYRSWSPAADPLAASQTLAQAHQRGALVVGVKADQPGLSVLTDPQKQRYQGFDVDLASYLAKDLGFAPDQVQFTTVQTFSRELVLQNRTVDLVVASYSMTPERAQQVTFAGPYYLAGEDFLLRTDEKDVVGPEDLVGRKVCTARGSTPAERLPVKFHGIRLTYRSSYGECVADLLAHRADAVSTDDIILAGYQKQHPDKLRLLGIPFQSEAYGVGMARGENALRTEVCAAIDRYVDSGAWRRSWQRWLQPLGLLRPSPGTCSNTDWQRSG
ncbi:bifunctional serine/threonine-protein kinase/glutamate ABC transporter substrate-binding protein [Streptacidiphilus griseoplanus]|uniref:bifunctional serine/threonine-protein kinase/glutamate ABC transporter substrate-binding protein n=1 Tax=Peterkaempfera griseoplana TaxID=66896 RepID=UPI000AB0554F|nr:bifunctional serine/threonine-protein kinase/glutamate ABC transporter substrate-binding protein [Peterkaempfera griseoplana]